MEAAHVRFLKPVLEAAVWDRLSNRRNKTLTENMVRHGGRNIKVAFTLGVTCKYCRTQDSRMPKLDYFRSSKNFGIM
jgi:hypothetical protein